MPFSLALSTKMRHNILQGVKTKDSAFYNSTNSTTITQKLRQDFVPGEKAKFLEKRIS